MRWIEYVACTGKEGIHIKCWSKNLREETAWRLRYRWEDNINKILED
jgi:hypothetical protein